MTIGKERFTLYLGGADGGTFTLGDGTTNTSAIAFDATAATIEGELEDVYGAGNVTVETDTDFTIEIDISAATGLEASFTNLTNATDPALTLLSTEVICVIDTISPDAWAADTAYGVDDYCTNDGGNVYVCITAGTSASSGGPTGTGSGITDGTAEWDYYHRDYTSLDAAIVGESGASPVVVTSSDLVANDEQLTFECRASSGTADTNHVNVTGFTTDSTRFVKIITHADHRHAGVWDTNKYRLYVSPDDNLRILLVEQSYTRIIGVQAQVHTVQWYDRAVFQVLSAYDYVTFDQCVACCDGAAVNSNGFTFQSDNGAVRNCVAYGFTGNSGFVDAFVENTTYSNNTAYDCNIGFLGHWTESTTLHNNIAVGCTTDYSDLFASASDYNISSDTTAPGTNSITNTIVKDATTDTLTAALKSTDNWVIFADPSNGDFSLVSVDDGGELNDAIDAGTDLSASMDEVDIIGTTRPQGGAWDIGAFEYVVEDESLQVPGPGIGYGPLGGFMAGGVWSGGGVEVTITIDDISQSQLVGALSLSQAIELAIASISQSQTIDTPALQQLIGLTIQAVQQGQSISSPALQQLQILSIQAVQQSQIIDAPALQQLHSLTIAAVNQGQTISAPALQQIIELTIQAVAQGQSVDSLVLQQLQSLTIQAVQQGQSVESQNLAQKIDLVVADIQQGQLVDSPQLSLVGALVIYNVLQAQGVSTPALDQQIHLVINSVQQDQVVGEQELAQIHSLLIDAVYQAQLVDLVTLEIPGVLVINSVLQGQSVSAPTLEQAHGLLSVTNVQQGQSIDASVIDQVHGLLVDSISQSQTTESPELEQLIQLAIDSVSQGQSLDESSFFQTFQLSIDNISQTQSAGALSVSQVSGLIIDNIAQGQIIENIHLSIAAGRVVVTITTRKPGGNFGTRQPGGNFETR